jgi:hypothetical protein
MVLRTLENSFNDGIDTFPQLHKTTYRKDPLGEAYVDCTVVG